MEIIVTKSFEQPCVSTMTKSYEDQNIIDVFKEFMARKGHVVDKNQIRSEKGQIIANNISPLLLHSFTLHLEQLGRNISYEKRTVIKIS